MTRMVLTAVDGSPESTAAARWAAGEAARRGLPLRVVHAQTWLDNVQALPTEPEQRVDAEELGRRLLADTVREVRLSHPALDVRTELAVGEEAIDVLVGAAAYAELLVIGSRGLGGFTGLLVGSVGLGVAGRSRTPVVLVRSAGEPAEPTQDGEVLVGVDSHDPAGAVLDFAFREARLRGVPLRAVHGWEPPPYWGYGALVPAQPEVEAFRSLEGELLSQALAGPREEYPDVKVVEDSRMGPAAGAVVEASAGASLVVVGRRDRQHPMGMRLGSVAHAVIHHAQAPVAVVPHD